MLPSTGACSAAGVSCSVACTLDEYALDFNLASATFDFREPEVAAMAGYDIVTLSDSVGKDAPNKPDDARAAQNLLNTALPAGRSPLQVDGRFSDQLVAAIRADEEIMLGLLAPTGRLDPEGALLRVLNGAQAIWSAAFPTTDPPHLRGLISPLDPLAEPHLRGRIGATPPPTAPPPSSKMPHTSSSGAIPPEVVAAAVAAHKTWNVPASMCLAQWLQESGGGRHMPAGSNNPFGMKAVLSQPHVWAWTWEEFNHKKVRVRAPFRSFPTWPAAFDAYGKYLATSHHFVDARKYRTDGRTFIKAAAGIYATDDNYYKAVIAWMDKYDLTQYDR